MNKHTRVVEAAEEHLVEHGSSCLFGTGVLLVLSVGILAGNPVVAAGGALMAGLLVISRLVRDMRSGVSSSNWGTWRRVEDSTGFRRNICFWSIVAVVWFVVSAMTVLEWIPLPSS